MTSFQDNFKRTEIKYLLNEAQYEAFMDRISKIARIDAYGKTQILNIYFDTPDFQLIRTSLEKPVYKEKLRLRTYGTPGDETNAFVEIKKKFKGVVYKRRISLPYAEAVEYLANGDCVHRSQCSPQIVGEIDAFVEQYEDLEPKMMISYNRIALEGIEDPALRITFDTDICWRTNHLDLRNGGQGRPLLKEGEHLMEIKITGAMDMEIARILSELSIFPASFSKYGKGYMNMVNLAVARQVAFETAAAHAERGVTAYA